LITSGSVGLHQRVADAVADMLAHGYGEAVLAGALADDVD
jgi:hypothetical protein